ncbi:MAG: DJ-1/PfpI family protein [Pseudomonadota bacterium]
MKIQMFVYPGMTLLDLVGPLQVWNSWPGAEFQIVGQTKGEVQTDSALPIVATHSFDGSWEDPDILFAPGGAAGTFALLEDDQVISFLAERGERAGWVTSVCTGSVLLGAAGLLKGYRATSHWIAADLLTQFGATVVSDRWVIDHNRATGGGVTAGVDFGLAIMAHVLKDENAAKMVQLMLEYAPKPPFSCGSPDTAEPGVVASVVKHYGATGAKLRERQVAHAVARLARVANETG